MLPDIFMVVDKGNMSFSCRSSAPLQLGRRFRLCHVSKLKAMILSDVGRYWHFRENIKEDYMKYLSDWHFSVSTYQLCFSTNLRRKLNIDFVAILYSTKWVNHGLRDCDSMKYRFLFRLSWFLALNRYFWFHCDVFINNIDKGLDGDWVQDAKGADKSVVASIINVNDTGFE